MKLEHFLPEHAHLIEGFEQDGRMGLTPRHWELASHCEHAYTIFDEERPVACAGVVEYWPGRAEAWAILDKKCKISFIGLHNVVKRFLDICPVKRIEATIEVGFKAGHRWVQALGFEREGLLKSYFPNGSDAVLYARVR